MAHVERDAELHVLGARRSDVGARDERHFEVPVRHPELGEQLVDRARESLRGGRARARERGRGLLQVATQLGAALLEIAQVEIGRVHELELGARAGAGVDDVGQRGPVLLGERVQQVASALDLGEARRIEVHAPGVVVELAGHVLERVERGVVALLEPRERGVDALERRQRSLYAA